MPAKKLRAVGEDERRTGPMTLTEAVDSGDVLAMLLAQRRLIADALVGAQDNTRPQLNNELNKLHALIAAEETRIAASAAEESASDDKPISRPFDVSAV